MKDKNYDKLLKEYNKLKRRYQKIIDISDRQINSALEEIEKNTKFRKKVENILGIDVYDKDEKEIKDIISNMDNESKMHLVNEMIGNIAHQWKQPLNIISLASIMLKIAVSKDKCDKEKILESVNNIEINIKYMADVISTFSDFVNSERKEEHFYLSDVFEKITKLLESRLKHIDLVLDIDNIEYFGFEKDLIEVMLVIVNNALDNFKEKGTQNPKIIIKAYEKDEFIFIEVEDNGGGVPEEIKDKIFEKNFTTKAHSNGSGIGLYMAKKLIDKSFNGEILVENTDKGAKFIIKLLNKKKD